MKTAGNTVPVTDPEETITERSNMAVEMTGARVHGRGDRAMTYRIIGSGTELIVLLHGLGGDSSDWTTAPMKEAMRAVDATFIAIDLPAHSPQGSVGAYSDVRDLVCRIAEIPLAMESSFGVVGYSFGGYVGIQFLAAVKEAAWGVFSGVPATLFETHAREAFANKLRGPGDPDPETIWTKHFIASRGRSIDEVDKLLRLKPLVSDPLPREAFRQTSTLADHGDAVILSEIFGGNPDISRLDGSHVSAFLDGTFLRAALNNIRPIGHVDRDRLVVLLGGLPCSGKSTLARALAGAEGHVSSDVVRHALFHSRSYSPTETSTVYEAMAHKLEDCWSRGAGGKVLVLDATYVTVSPSLIRHQVQQARQSGAEVARVFLTAPVETLLERFESRRSGARADWNMSEADPDVIRGLAGRRPPLFTEVDTNLFDDAELLHLVRRLADRSPDPMTSDAWLLCQQILARAATGFSDPITSPQVAGVINAIRAQIAQDLAAGMFDRWARSTLVDENIGRTVVPPEVMRSLSEWAGLADDYPIANAGLAHTYGYLLSKEMTPYGWKRDRWLDGRLPAALGADSRMLSPKPPEGTLLANLTHCFEVVTNFEDADVWLSTGGAAVDRLRETDPTSGITLETWLVSSPNSEWTALLYDQLVGRHRIFISAFPVDDQFAQSVRERASSRSSLTPRFNAVVSPISQSPATRALERIR